MHFTLVRDGAAPEEITVNLPGVHNVLNSLAAIGVALTLDVPMEASKKHSQPLRAWAAALPYGVKLRALREKVPGCR